MFQLDQAIEDWRRACGSGEAVSDSASMELESHLRDSIDRLCESGLCEEEAFLVACHRLGKPAQIHDEYSKVHRRHIWLSRTILMLGGYLTISLILKFIAVEQATVGLVGLLLGWDTTGVPLSRLLYGDALHHHWSALLGAAVGLMGLGVMVWLLVSFSRGPGHKNSKSDNSIQDRLFRFFDKAPPSIGKLVVGWAVFYAVLSFALVILNVVLGKFLSPSEIGSYRVSSTIYNHGNHFITIIVLLLLTVLLCRRYRNLNALPE